MSRDAAIDNPVLWRFAASTWAGVALIAIALLFGFRGALASLVDVWQTQEEYSFGYLVPLIAGFLLWQRKPILAQCRLEGSWSGVAFLASGLGLGLLGRLSSIGPIAQYAFLLSLFGLVLTGCGWRGVRILAAPLATLCFMVPLPNFLLVDLSTALQLLSSQLGVAMIRLADISVYLEGNVIDFGTMKLQVVEACSGLRYLLPLLTLGFITAQFYRAATWKRVFLVLSTIPIAVLMNAARIALVGVTVQHFGKAAAEGFLHDFEGWAVFMACMAALFALMFLMTKIGADRRPMRDVFGFDAVAPVGSDAPRRVRALPAPFLVGGALLLAWVLVTLLLPEPESILPARKDFSDFPLRLGGWSGRPESLDASYLDVLKPDDYLLVDYLDDDRASINLYVPYYATQRSSNSSHSPRGCLPGDGWEIQSFTQNELPALGARGAPLRVNRVVIQKGETKQLVYYWFQQRGRNITGEYEAKFWILWDSLRRSRSDGAMVRLVTPLARGESLSAADARLASFIALAEPALALRIPD
jgi:exosortase D (VPLPA-CTERM-specific)